MTRLHETIIRGWAAGLSHPAIADRAGVGVSTVKRVLAGARALGDPRAASRQTERRADARMREGLSTAEVLAIRALWRTGSFDTAEIARLLNLPEALVAAQVGDEGESVLPAEEAGPEIVEALSVEPEVLEPEPEVVEPEVFATAIVEPEIVEPEIVDLMPAKRRLAPKPPRATPEISALAEQRREAIERQTAREAAEALNAEILRALKKERRPKGVARRYLEIASAALVEPVIVARGPVDLTARFFGDPPPGRSALDMRGAGR